MNSAKLTAAGTQMSNRQHYLDWLRVITILVVFLFHCGRFFDSDDWHVKNATSSFTADVLIYALIGWMMPLFFFISGGSTWYALQSKTGGRFTMDRVKRIGVPFIFGVFFLSPHQVYLERLTHGQFTGSFIAFLPHYFSGMYAFGGNFAWMGLHLWYLLLLFLFSLLALPLFLLLKRRRAAQLVTGKPADQNKPANQNNSNARLTLIYVICFVILLALPGCLFTPDDFPGLKVWGGWNIVEHLFLFILGYYSFSRQDIIRSWYRYRYFFLLATILLTTTSLYLFVHHMFYFFGTLPYVLKVVLRSAVCLSWIFTLLGFGADKLNYTNRTLRYCNEAVLPFYIIHQPVIILIGYYIVQLHLPIGVKYGVIVLISFTLVMAIYQLIIKRIPAVRFLFGMGKAVKV